MRTPFCLAAPGFAVGTAEGERCFRFRPLYARASLAFRKLSVWLIVGIAISLAEPGFAGQSFDDEFDVAMTRFWAAATDEEFRAAVDAVLETQPDIETIWSRLRRGRDYQSDVPTGRQLLSRTNRDGVTHGYILQIPEGYTPERRYPVRVYLHGGVMRPKRDDGSWWRNEDRMLRDDTIVVFPASWDESIWWQDSQIENLSGVINEIKQTYNVAENQVYLLGISDGGTGAYYHAFKSTTPWAGFLSFIGHPGVLGNASSAVDGQMHVTNLRNKPFFVVNGGQDRLYPTVNVVPFLRLFQEAGVFINFRPQPESGHDLSWWDNESSAIDSFIEEVHRRPLPNPLSWETERTDKYSRAHWLVIDELGPVEGEPDLGAFNEIVDPSSGAPLGINTIGEMADGTGLRIFEVGENSIVSEAGMRADDTIVEIEGQEAPTVEMLKEALMGFSPGDQLSLVVLREDTRTPLVLNYPETAAPRMRQAFPLQQASGRVELRMPHRNTVSARTRGVRRFTLLLSPEEFDFTAPVSVEVNGVPVIEQMVEADVEALLRWAAIDQDRTMLFGAELEIVVPSGP